MEKLYTVLLTGAQMRTVHRTLEGHVEEILQAFAAAVPVNPEPKKADVRLHPEPVAPKVKTRRNKSPRLKLGLSHSETVSRLKEHGLVKVSDYIKNWRNAGGKLTAGFAQHLCKKYPNEAIAIGAHYYQ